MPVINKSDHWDDEFERINPKMTVKRIHSLKELKDLGFDVRTLPPNDQADPQPGQRPPSIAETAQTPSDVKTEPLTAVGSSALFGDQISKRISEVVIKEIAKQLKPGGLLHDCLKNKTNRLR